MQSALHGTITETLTLSDQLALINDQKGKGVNLDLNQLAQETAEKIERRMNDEPKGFVRAIILRALETVEETWKKEIMDTARQALAGSQEQSDADHLP